MKWKYGLAMDKIYIDNLKIFAHHGVYDFENEKGQYFYVNATLYTDLSRAGREDNLELSTNYGEVCSLIYRVVTENTYKLIETVAEKVAGEILRNFPLIKSIDIEVRKPNAPIDMEFESVSVKITRGWHTAVVALGSNIGDKQEFIRTAVEDFSDSQRDNIKDLIMSDLIVTEPYGYTEQDKFLNGVMMFSTTFNPHELLKILQSLENNAGRKREIHWGPRTLDLDLIFYDNEIISTCDLTVPHPDMHNRDFVLQPLCQIAPWYMHPVFHKRADMLLEELKRKNG